MKTKVNLTCIKKPQYLSRIKIESLLLELKKNIKHMGIHNNQKPIIHSKEDNSKGHKWALLRNLQTDNCTICWFNYRYLKYKQAHSTDFAKHRNYKDHPTRQLKAQNFSHFILILSTLCNKIIRILRVWTIVSLDFVEKIACIFWPDFTFWTTTKWCNSYFKYFWKEQCIR